MREKYIDHAFKPDSLARIEQINDVIAEYQAQDLRLTLRQLFYVFVSRNMLENTPQSYDNLGSLLSNARLAGAVDWDAIEDRVRAPYSPAEWTDPGAAAREAVEAFRLPRWEGQPRYVELWVEKSALAGVLMPLAREHHVTLMVNRGYTSTSAVYDSAKRYIFHCCGADERQCPVCKGESACPSCGGEGRAPVMASDGVADIVDCPACEGSCVCQRCGGAGAVNERRKDPILFYLGDHDPSGEDMVRDVKKRMVTLGVDGIRVFKIALTAKQIELYDPPPNAVKESDSRAGAYVEKHGAHSWEVDALPPAVLTEIIRNAFARVIDRARMDAVIVREAEARARFARAVAGLE